MPRAQCPDGIAEGENFDRCSGFARLPGRLLAALGGAEADAGKTSSAKWALAAAEALFEGSVKAPRAAAPGVGGSDATLVLRRLSLAYPKLDGADRRQAKALLERPPVGQHAPAENQLGSGWNVPEAPQSPACTKHFCVHWVATSNDAPPLADSNGNGVPNYVEKVISTVERTYRIENRKLAWPKPKSDGKRGGNSKTDIYLSEIGNVGLFGYANNDPGQSGMRRFAYLVLDNDYKGFAPLTPLHALQVTVAHEYNHILQFGIDYYEQIWMYESSATWMEEQVYPAVSDWLRYVPAFAANPDEPITRPEAGAA